MRGRLILSSLAMLGVAGLLRGCGSSEARTESPPSFPRAESSIVEPWQWFGPGSPRIVDLRIPEGMEQRLTEREMREQRLDWLLLAVVSDAGLDAERLGQVLFDLPVTRYGYVKQVAVPAHGDTRSRLISEGRALALVPAGLDEDARFDRVAAAFDRHRKDQAGAIEEVLVFEYRLLDGGRRGEVVQTGSMTEDALLGPGSGYHERTLRSVEDLEGFLDETDLLTYATAESGALRVGGRKERSSEYRGIGVEEVATLWQAEAEIERGGWGVDGLGFSLDPENRPDEFGWLLSMVESVTSLDEARAFRELVDAQDKGRMLLFLLFLAERGHPEVLNTFTTIGEFQKARYDGPIKGTEVGMVLFYTDLLAKLWATNFGQSAPAGAVSGFVHHEQLEGKLSAVFAKEAEELPHGRLWFEPSKSGLQTAAGPRLYLDQYVARVFSKGRTTSEDTDEVQTSLFLGAPIDWWDEHYVEVARYEREFQRLNEILKWTLVFSWMVEEGDRAVQRPIFLETVDVERDHWFPDWARDNDRLRFDQWNELKFHERGYMGNETETMEIPVSRVSGGHSLGKRQIFRERARIDRDLPPELRWAGLDYRSLTSGGRGLKTLDGRKLVAESLGPDRSRVTVSPPERLRLRTHDADVANADFVREIRTADSDVDVHAKTGDRGLGSLRVRHDSLGSRVDWRSRDVDLGQNLARRASRRPDPQRALRSDPTVDMVVELGEPGHLLVKQRESESWAEIAIRDETGSALQDGWQSRVAAPGAEKVLHLRWRSAEEAASTLGSEGLLEVRPSATGEREALLARVSPRGPPPPAGGRAVSIETPAGTVNAFSYRGSSVVVARLDGLGTSGGAFLDGLAATSRRNLVRQIQEGSVDLGQSRSGRTLAELLRGEARDVAVELGSKAENLQQARERLRRALDGIGELHRQGRSAEALDALARLRETYGEQSEILLWEGLLRLDEASPQQLAAVLNKASGTELDRGSLLLKELDRQHTLAADPVRREKLATARRVGNWATLPAGKRGGRPRVEANGQAGFRVDFEVPGPFMGARRLTGPEVADALRADRAHFYRPEKGDLGARDWSVPLEEALPPLIEGDIARVFAFDSPAMVRLQPDSVSVVESAPSLFEGIGGRAVSGLSRVGNRMTGEPCANDDGGDCDPVVYAILGSR